MEIYDVPVELKEEEVMDCIYQQNLSEDLTEEQFRLAFRMRFRIGPREKSAIQLRGGS